ncbi:MULTISPECIES: hypothetical protein [Rhodococcus]|uniref:Uncharacterized protein n=1 Tax=Rhodococcus pyridinivorans AK37 TaxID=1114960 RepID=H0JVZ2_9NOCA|nr:MULTISPECIES: hypothetical protein [Rhodococcus]AOD22084.1 hypothetical protein IM25_11070 [Rhodococcus sp. p52]APE08055.1 hypothetical protein BO226_01460 [Rhodococcus sp. 2G]AWZ24096.1 hypothetical protein CEJ39_07800 [Rhodococcus pyridinivorans]EHK81543.1 hypothetical protein AK37_19298 [Rhodococcus pyridinivorans AK37]KHJ74625.1 hypothetical protein QR64_00625 [Rhodococcus sp. Chr-9]
MSDDRDPSHDEVTGEQQQSRARIDRARLARIFGDVLPETTRDERGENDSGGGDSDEWLRRQVPPHHSGG